MIEENFLKTKLRAGAPVMGIWNTMASPLVTEVIASAGLDFVIVDFEHGAFDVSHLPAYVNACERYRVSPIVRVPSKADWIVLQAFDGGAHGVIAPHIDSVSDARALASWCRYHPEGIRGFTPFTKAGGFSNLNGKAYAAKANDFVLSIALVESREGLDDIEAIASVPGIDVVYFGAYDISNSLGVPGQVKDKKVVDAIVRASQVVRAAGKAAGGFVAQSRDDVTWQIDQGLSFITFNVDTAVLHAPLHDVSTWFHGVYPGGKV